MPNAILDPTGAADAGPPGEKAAPSRAGRHLTLSGLRVGLLENTKQNADILLAEVGRLLVDEHGAAQVAITRVKPVFAQPAPQELVDEFASGCDVVVTGVGDCGSCSAAAVADGVGFEQAGLPAAVVCSDAFAATADAMAAMRGADGYAYVTTPHPVAVLTPEQVRERAARLTPEIVAVLTAGGGR